MNGKPCDLDAEVLLPPPDPTWRAVPRVDGVLPWQLVDGLPAAIPAGPLAHPADHRNWKQDSTSGECAFQLAMHDRASNMATDFLCVTMLHLNIL